MAKATETLAIVHPVMTPLKIVPVHVCYLTEYPGPWVWNSDGTMSGSLSRYGVYAYGLYLGSVEQPRLGEWLSLPPGGTSLFTNGLVSGTRALAACALAQEAFCPGGVLEQVAA